MVDSLEHIFLIIEHSVSLSDILLVIMKHSVTMSMIYETSF